MKHPCHRSFTLLLFALLRLGRSSGTADSRPSCRRCDPQLSCNCSCGGFTRVPTVTDHARTLDLSFNNITALTDDDLKGHEQLKVLDLHANRIAIIHPSALDSLWSLEELDLSDNRLSTLNHSWFSHLGALQKLHLLNNPYSRLGSPPLFRGLVGLRSLAFGGPALQELRRGDLHGVTQLDELTVHANNLARYQSGALADIWPLGHVTLSLHGPFLTNPTLASAVLSDVSYPETPITLEDIHLTGNESAQALREAARKRIRQLSFRNLSMSDEAAVGFLLLFDGVPLTSLSFDGVTLTGDGSWVPANKTNLGSMDEIFVRNLVVVDILSFFMTAELYFLFQFQRKMSIINSKLFLVSCKTTQVMVNTEYLDVSDNLLTDMTLEYMMCEGSSTLKELRVLNISGNPLKSLSTVSRLVAKLTKMTHLDISRTSYSSMPSSCSWPSALRYLNISMSKLTTTTPCLPTSLEVLDLSYNDLRDFTVLLPVLRELYLSGNKFLRLPSGNLLVNLRTLTIQSNTLNVFSHSDLQSFRRLQNLQAGQNKFICSCTFVPFLQFLLRGGGDVQLTDGEASYVCDSPLHLQGKPVSGVHLSVVECHQVLFVSVSCGLALVVGVVLCVLLWRLHVFWYMSMTWAWLKAKRSSKNRRRRDTEGWEALLSFDAFVSYSERDAGWVENFLVPELEEPSDSNSGNASSFTLCLHKRDFLPGHWIMDNIMNAIERSRRTVFVLSENFVHSDWCRYELDFSHFWLFDVGGDAAILILLEPLSKDDVPKRFCKLRKIMSSTTYLEWPQEEERRPEFWRSLRNALRGDQEDN
ncbi:toll-like receptor 2 [Cololabis saira]|uniref:toll-like receptor 2 n=1 Tax=Cololabis saira TaxID=129043 RepID=UPI002AD1E38E|nr:toll-like receptor 2 [Cololabis saira]